MPKIKVQKSVARSSPPKAAPALPKHASDVEFDDAALIDLARSRCATVSEPSDPAVADLLRGPNSYEEFEGPLSNTERNKLIAYLYQTKYNKPMTGSDMKAEILNIIGYKGSESYGGSVNKAELEAIYRWVTRRAVSEKSRVNGASEDDHGNVYFRTAQ